MTRVRFWLNWHVQYGQNIQVVGSHEHLGALLLSSAWAVLCALDQMKVADQAQVGYCIKDAALHF